MTIQDSEWSTIRIDDAYYAFYIINDNNDGGCQPEHLDMGADTLNDGYHSNYHVTIVARFRKYKNLSEGIKGYYDFLQYKRYKNLKGVTDYKKACDLIRQDGWATSLSYAQNLKNYIKRYNLDKYDRYVLGTENVMARYTVTASAIKIREGAGIRYSQKAEKDCVSAQSNILGMAVYRKGSTIEVHEVITISPDEIWGRTVDGYVALKHGGKSYVG